MLKPDVYQFSVISAELLVFWLVYPWSNLVYHSVTAYTNSSSNVETLGNDEWELYVYYDQILFLVHCRKNRLVTTGTEFLSEVLCVLFVLFVNELKVLDEEIRLLQYLAGS